MRTASLQLRVSTTLRNILEPCPPIERLAPSTPPPSPDAPAVEQPIPNRCASSPICQPQARACTYGVVQSRRSLPFLPVLGRTARSTVLGSDTSKPERSREAEGSKAIEGEGGYGGGVLRSPAGHGVRNSDLALQLFAHQRGPTPAAGPRLYKLLRAHRHHHRTRPRPDRVDETAICLAIAMSWSARRRRALALARSFRVRASARWTSLLARAFCFYSSQTRDVSRPARWAPRTASGCSLIDSSPA